MVGTLLLVPEQEQGGGGASAPRHEGGGLHIGVGHRCIKRGIEARQQPAEGTGEPDQGDRVPALGDDRTIVTEEGAGGHVKGLAQGGGGRPVHPTHRVVHDRHPAGGDDGLEGSSHQVGMLGPSLEKDDAGGIGLDLQQLPGVGEEIAAADVLGPDVDRTLDVLPEVVGGEEGDVESVFVDQTLQLVEVDRARLLVAASPLVLDLEAEQGAFPLIGALEARELAEEVPPPVGERGDEVRVGFPMEALRGFRAQPGRQPAGGEGTSHVGARPEDDLQAGFGAEFEVPREVQAAFEAEPAPAGLVEGPGGAGEDGVEPGPAKVAQTGRPAAPIEQGVFAPRSDKRDPARADQKTPTVERYDGHLDSSIIAYGDDRQPDTGTRDQSRTPVDDERQLHQNQ